MTFTSMSPWTRASPLSLICGKLEPLDGFCVVHCDPLAVAVREAYCVFRCCQTLFRRVPEQPCCSCRIPFDCHPYLICQPEVACALRAFGRPRPPGASLSCCTADPGTRNPRPRRRVALRRRNRPAVETSRRRSTARGGPTAAGTVRRRRRTCRTASLRRVRIDGQADPRRTPSLPDSAARAATLQRWPGIGNRTRRCRRPGPRRAATCLCPSAREAAHRRGSRRTETNRSPS